MRNAHSVEANGKTQLPDQASRAMGGGLALSFCLPLGREATTSEIFVPNACIQIGIDSQVVLIMPYVEIGQGTHTSIPMLIAEELDVPLRQVRLEHAPPNQTLFASPVLDAQPTGNSNAIRGAWKPLRQAGAAARIMLVAAAAQLWNVDANSCRAQEGEVIHVPSGKRLSYGELAAEATNMPAPRGHASMQAKRELTALKCEGDDGTQTFPACAKLEPANGMACVHEGA
jgi:isoquinoline 1-oxidoreductase subunit beta